MNDGKSSEIRLPDGDRLILDYSSSRATKDAYNRKRGMERLISVNRIGMSLDKVLDVTKTVVTVRKDMTQKGELHMQILFLTEDHRRIKPLFNLDETEMERG